MITDFSLVHIYLQNVNCLFYGITICWLLWRNFFVSLSRYRCITWYRGFNSPNQASFRVRLYDFLGLLELSSGIRNTSYLSVLFHVDIKRTIHFLRHEIFYFIFHFLFSSLVSKNCSPLDVYTFLFYTRTYTSKANLPKSPHNLFFIKSKKKGGKRIHRVLQFIFFRMYFFCPTVSADNV